MKKTISILSLATILFLLISCRDSAPKINVENKNSFKSKIVELKDSLVSNLTIDNRYVFIKGMLETKKTLYIYVDYVDYLTGKEALDAEWRDQAYFIDGVDTISNITNGFYISNVNPKIRTFKIGKNTRIENIVDDSGSHKIRPLKTPDKKQLQKYMDLNTLLILKVEDGLVKSIDERFMP